MSCSEAAIRVAARGTPPGQLLYPLASIPTVTWPENLGVETSQLIIQVMERAVLNFTGDRATPGNGLRTGYENRSHVHSDWARAGGACF